MLSARALSLAALRRLSGADALVPACLLLASIPLGFLAFRQFTRSDRILAQQQRDLLSQGASLSLDQCLRHVLALRANCQAIPALCDHAVGSQMDACVAAADRTEDCRRFGPQTRSTRFGFDTCMALARADRSARSACATAFRAIAAACERYPRQP